MKLKTLLPIAVLLAAAVAVATPRAEIIEQILVKVIAIDPTGKIQLSRKALLQPEEAGAGAPKPS